MLASLPSPSSLPRLFFILRVTLSATTRLSFSFSLHSPLISPFQVRLSDPSPRAFAPFGHYFRNDPPPAFPTPAPRFQEPSPHHLRPTPSPPALNSLTHSLPRPRSSPACLPRSHLPLASPACIIYENLWQTVTRRFTGVLQRKEERE